MEKTTLVRESLAFLTSLSIPQKFEARKAKKQEP